MILDMCYSILHVKKIGTKLLSDHTETVQLTQMSLA